MTDYQTLNSQLAALIHGVPHQTANLANAAALLYHTLDGLNWAGFYLLEEDTLVLGPFQGKPACIEIPVGRGVCGTAVAEGRTQLVRDVHQFPGHIACDSASNAEIVVPIRAAVNEPRFSNIFIEKRGSFYLQAVAISRFLLFMDSNLSTPFFQNSVTIILPSTAI